MQGINGKAQNLVPNPSFEQYDTCPVSVGEVSHCLGWSSFSETPDYFNSCADSASFVNVPFTGCGYQYAATGNAFCGMICTSTTFPNYREIIGCHLLSPLQVGTTYYITFKVNMSYGGYAANFVASNGMGIKFTTKQYSFNNPIPIDNNPAIFAHNILTDSINWISISGSYVADSAYQYLAIGNFFDNVHTDTIHLGSFIFRSYYFVDDICVSNNADGCLVDINDDSIDNLFEIFPNPTHDFINIKSTKKLISIKIYNAMGNLIFDSDINTRNPDSIYKIDCRQFKLGIYFIKISNNNYYSTKKLIIN